ncbi:hypothetical protein HYH02_014908 [Chlamydomonas schloesseri]|uniref:Kinesin motor domain-containing protein n=1 Tax=Chlamydomonas schloesseri TaxID=2026947 RepID=A0A835VU36_9CHLO|nr:hypothetical protein HYH02_014908 [Chlamydomonas schloesseri]|eukprot:KAG2425908.1 hypothetical protein HYH02_014908 [Chlamydomonas schloesseri]
MAGCSSCSARAAPLGPQRRQQQHGRRQQQGCSGVAVTAACTASYDAATSASARRAVSWRLLAAPPPFGCRSLAQPPFGCCGQRSHLGVCSPRCLMAAAGGVATLRLPQPGAASFRLLRAAQPPRRLLAALPYGGCWRRRHPSVAAAWRSLLSAAAGSAATSASARRAASWRLLAASPQFGCRSLAQPPFGCCGQRSHLGVCSPRCLMAAAGGVATLRLPQPGAAPLRLLRAAQPPRRLLAALSHGGCWRRRHPSVAAAWRSLLSAAAGSAATSASARRAVSWRLLAAPPPFGCRSLAQPPFGCCGQRSHLGVCSPRCLMAAAGGVATLRLPQPGAASFRLLRAAQPPRRLLAALSHGGCWRRRHPSVAAAWRSLLSAAAGSAATSASARRAASWRLLAASPQFGCRGLAQPPFGCCGQRSHHGVCSPRCLMAAAGGVATLRLPQPGAASFRLLRAAQPPRRLLAALSHGGCWRHRHPSAAAAWRSLLSAAAGSAATSASARRAVSWRLLAAPPPFGCRSLAQPPFGCCGQRSHLGVCSPRCLMAAAGGVATLRLPQPGAASFRLLRAAQPPRRLLAALPYGGCWRHRHPSVAAAWRSLLSAAAGGAATSASARRAASWRLLAASPPFGCSSLAQPPFGCCGRRSHLGVCSPRCLMAAAGGTATLLRQLRIRPPVRSGAPPLSIKGQYGSFTFDYVIEEGTSQEETFEYAILPSVQNFLQGVSSVVLAYGANSTGKTYSLEGGPAASRREGAIPRALHAICKNLAVVPKHRYKLYVTYCALSAGVEAQLVDLLAPGSPPVSLKDGSATTALARLLHYQVESYEDVYEVLRQGRMTRAAAFTAAGGSPDLRGGRGAAGAVRGSAAPLTGPAHVMLNIQLTGFAASGEQLATNLTFVELAAPEAKDMMGYPSGTDGGVTRSLSLAYTALSGVIAALRAGGGRGGGGESPPPRHSHVPWRDSPLTRWLKGCLAGAGSILVIAHVAPGPEAAADTLATLSYVNRLRSGPKSDGLVVTATWDAAGGAAPGFEAAAAQQEVLQATLQRASQAQQAQRERMERELLLDRERHDRARERERQGQRLGEGEAEGERFGSPIQVRGSPSSMAGSSLRPQSQARYSPPTQLAPSLDTRYTTAPASVTSHRSVSVPRSGTPAASAAAVTAGPGSSRPPAGSTVAASVRSSLHSQPHAAPGPVVAASTPRSHHSQLSSPKRSSHTPEPSEPAAPLAASAAPSIQPLRTSDVLSAGGGGQSTRASSVMPPPSTSRQPSQRLAPSAPPSNASASLPPQSLASAPLAPPSHTSTHPPAPSMPPAAQSAAASQSQSRAGPLSDLLASLQLGGGSQQQRQQQDQQQQHQLQPQPFAVSESSFGPSSASRRTGAPPSDFGAAGPAPTATGAGAAAAYAAAGADAAALDALGRQVEQLRAELGAERRETQRLRAEVSSLESAHRTAADMADAQSALALAEARVQVEALRKQLDTSEGAKQVLVRRVQQLQEQQGAVLDLQAESSLLEAQVRALQDSLDGARSAHSSLAGQLADAKAAAEALRQDRDHLQRQNIELSEKLQAQVRALSDETARLRSQVLEAAGQVEAEQVARRAAEAALAQVRVQVESSRGAEGSALQQAAALAAQVKELGGALEAVRAERNKLQEAKWRSDERAEQLGLELEAALTQRAKQDMEARAAATKAESDLRSAIVAAEGLKVELGGARSQADSLKQELRAAQLAAEEAARRESALATDVQEVEGLMRELDRDLEVQVNAVWRQLRSERADSLFGRLDVGSLPPARRWRPVLTALVGIVKRNANEAERQAQALEQARERCAALEASAAAANELATSLAAHQQIKAAQLAELDESRRGVALMDQALAEANRECQRLHRQLEEATAAHKAFAAEASAREARMQAHLAEREATLQAQVSDREERLRAATAEHEKRLAAVTAEWENRLQTQLGNVEAQAEADAAEAAAKLRDLLDQRDSALSAAEAEGAARLAAAVAEREAQLQRAVAEADARLREAVAEREARLAALAGERESLARQVASLSAVQADDRQERDALRLRAHGRDQLLNILWSEVRAAKLAAMGPGGAGGSPPRTPAPGGFGFGVASSSSLSSSPAGAGLLAAAAAADADAAGPMDWGEPLCQERLLQCITTVRVQVSKLQGEVGSLRAGAGLAEELGAQLGAARGRLGEAQRGVEQLTARVGALEEQLREEQKNRSSLQQQLASGEAAAAALQSSLSEARQTIASLQEEAAVLSKSRDTWKDTATQQEAQLRELYTEGELRAGELARLRAEAQAAATDACGATARVRLLESQLQDAQSQVEALGARLSATDKALGDANARAAALNGQLVLAESEARLKAQELLARVASAEDGEKLAKANAKEAMDRLEVRLRDASEQGSKLVADLDGLRAERNEAQLRADDLQRQLLEARARLADGELTARQLAKVVAERDGLQEQVNGLRTAHLQAADEARSLRRQLDAAQDQVARLGEDKARLAAAVEGQRLEAIMAGMAGRAAGAAAAVGAAGGVGVGVGAGGGIGSSLGRISALSRPGGGGGGVAEGVGLGGGAEARGTPAPAYRAYGGLSYPAVGVGSYGASPTVARPIASYGAGYGGGAAAGLAPFSPQAPATASSAPVYGETSLRVGMGMGGYVPQSGAGAGGAGEAMAVRVHIQASPADVGGTPAGGR